MTAPLDGLRVFEHPTHGPTKYVGVPVGLSEAPGSIKAPEHGQHTELLPTEATAGTKSGPCASAE